jgi:hypothetical protein
MKIGSLAVLPQKSYAINLLIFKTDIVNKKQAMKVAKLLDAEKISCVGILTGRMWIVFCGLKLLILAPVKLFPLFRKPDISAKNWPDKNILSMSLNNTEPVKEKIFSRYQVFMIAILAILQFTIVLDFMVLSPLGALLLEKLNINTSQFGWVVSAYAFSAGASGLLAAGFADKFDRKKLLLFFYTGFIIGTFLCALAPNYHMLLVARIVTGIFGGVIGSVSFAIITDLFKMEVRGRVMGFVQMAFAASQVLGLPIGLLLANRFGWHALSG